VVFVRSTLRARRTAKGGSIPTKGETIPTAWTGAAPPFLVGLPSQQIRSVAAGVHPAGFNERHVDRVLAVHELIFVQAGVLPIAEESEQHEVATDEWIVLRAGRRHYGCGPIDGTTWFLWVCFLVDGGELGDGPTLRGRTRDPARVRAIFDDLPDDLRSAEITQQAADAYTSLLLHQLTPTTERSRRESPPQIHDLVVAHVQANLDDPALTTSAIATCLGYHADYLGRAFRSAGGQSIVAHIHQQRVARARTLLETTPMPVARIAANVGFADHHYFRRIFLRHVGVTPAQYRMLFA
jgi:AraC-like DNA-binding protein